MIRRLSLILIAFSLSACLFKTEQPVLVQADATLVPAETGYLYGVDKRDGSVIAQKFERSPDAALKEYLLYDEVAAKAPFRLLFADLGDRAYLVQSHNPEMGRASSDAPFEFMILRIENGAGYALDGEASGFDAFVSSCDPRVFQGESDGLTAVIEVKDKAKFLVALKQFVKNAKFKPDPLYYDAGAMKRQFPGKPLPK